MNDRSGLELWNMLKEGMHDTIIEDTKNSLKLLPARVISVTNNSTLVVRLIGSPDDSSQNMTLFNASNFIPSVDEVVWVAYMYSMDNAFVMYTTKDLQGKRPMAGGSYIGDANDVKETVTYWCSITSSPSTTVTNLPISTSGSYGVLSCIQFGDTWFIQTFIQYASSPTSSNSCRTWQRIYVNGYWNTWSELSTGRNQSSICTAGNYYTVGTKVTLSASIENYRFLLFRVGSNTADNGCNWFYIPRNTITAIGYTTTPNGTTYNYNGFTYLVNGTVSNVAFKFNSATELEITGHTGASFGIRNIYGIN